MLTLIWFRTINQKFRDLDFGCQLKEVQLLVQLVSFAFFEICFLIGLCALVRYFCEHQCLLHGFVCEFQV